MIQWWTVYVSAQINIMKVYDPMVDSMYVSVQINITKVYDPMVDSIRISADQHYEGV